LLQNVSGWLEINLHSCDFSADNYQRLFKTFRYEKLTTVLENFIFNMFILIRFCGHVRYCLATSRWNQGM